MDQKTKEDGKTMAIICYITFIGLLIAYLMNNNTQNEFAKFHIGQSVRVVILVVANMVLGQILPYSLSIINSIIGLGALALLVIGIINAVNLSTKPLPIIGTIGA
ncbi:hypothetical protein U1E44_15375 [Arenibacter sp. GZD96]|uniref:hypothetical protein n=1 Tax=Aurantibrevibacter litoralis TaxID=3106030 RepID=UPI002AFF8012|nr:hypothetical protein [Arenibacter sp. GZD-96]MEA1787482.1 hypothetical protein [Arenibacter sp. GZD-96]